MRASDQLIVVLVVRPERARMRRCVEGCQVDLGTFEAHRTESTRVSPRVMNGLLLTLVGVATARQVHMR